MKKTWKNLTAQQRRMVGWTVFCALASGLFLYAASLLGGLSAKATLVVLVGPAAIVLLWTNVPGVRQMTHDADTRTRWRPQAERAPRAELYADVIEGEVVR